MNAKSDRRRRRNIMMMAAILWLGLLGAQRWELARLGAALADAREHQIFLTQRHRFETLDYKSTLGMVRPRLTHAEIEAKLKSFLPYLKGEFFRDTALWQEFKAALKPEDIAFALACMDQMPELRWPLSPYGSNSRADLHWALLELWLKNDPAAALGYATAIPEAGARQNTLRILLDDWIRKSPSDAAAWVAQQPAGVMRDEELDNVLRYLPADEGWDLLQNVSVSSPQMHASFVRYEMEKLAKDNPEEVAGEAAAGLAAGDARGRAVPDVATSWGAKDPEAALAWATALPMGSVRDEAEENAVVAWAKGDVVAAANYAAGSLTGVVRERILDQVVHDWTDKDSAGAGQWVQSLAAGPARDDALGSYVDLVAGQNPAQAATLAAGIGDEGLRNRAIVNVAGEWLKSDPGAATAWLAQSGLPEARAQKLLKAAGAGK